MRIGLVSAYALDVPGGVQGQVTGLAHELRARGHDCEVLAPGPSVNGSRSAGRALAVAANGATARLAVGPGLGGLVRSWSRDLDVVHLHEPLAPGLPQAVLLRCPVPVVATGHAASTSPWLRRARPALSARLARAAVLTAVSRHAAATLVLAGRAPDAIVPNGLAVPVAPVVPGVPVAPVVPVVLAVGRLGEPRKGIDVLLAAWPAVHRATGARLDLLGPGRPRAGAPLPPGVRLLGRRSDVERDTAVAAADVVVAPHRGGESFGLVIVEAMARGTPVVASALPAFTDLLDARPGAASGTGSGPVTPAGVLVPVADPAALAGAVIDLLGDPHRRARLGAEGRRRACAFDWAVVVPRYLGHYAGASGGGRSIVA